MREPGTDTRPGFGAATVLATAPQDFCYFINAYTSVAHLLGGAADAAYQYLTVLGVIHLLTVK